MIVFLIKVRVKTIFSTFNPVMVEPLELCYLKTVLDNMSIESYLIDDLFRLKSPKGINPDVVVLNGYNVAEEEIIRVARLFKAKYPKVKTIVGGVHIQGNTRNFHVEGVDYVFHSQSLNTFRVLIEKILNRDKDFLTEGVDSFIKEEASNRGYWHIGKKKTIYEREDILADRSILSQISNKLRYLERRNVALIKGNIGCPYHCSYCYCKVLNDNHYVKADYDMMVKEMENIKADYFWIVDDVLFSNRSEALDFIEHIKKRNIKIKIIGYLRADFIVREKDLLIKLKEIGLVEVIVGFEATSNDELKEYEKTTDALDYPKVISLLKENNIELTALFMVRPDYRLRDFWKLREFIIDHKIEVFTISILTPIKGTKGYELIKKDLVTQNPRKFDFMHLVLKSKLPKWIFYTLFYSIHLSLLRSKRIWKYILSIRGDKT